MSNFTREQIIEAAKHCSKGGEDESCVCKGCFFDFDMRDCNDCVLDFAHYIAESQKEEPAPSDNDTSSKENIVYKDDSTALKICQGALLKIEKCSSDEWTRGYCTAVREMFEAQKEENNVQMF